MRNFYALNPGEFFVAEEIAKHRRDLTLYLPLKDKGMDLLAVAHDSERAVRIQVKESRTYEATRTRPECGWHQVRKSKLDAADVFVFVVYAVNRKGAKPAFSRAYVVVPRDELKRLCKTKKLVKGNVYDFYYSVDGSEVREVRNRQHLDFSRFLSAWDLI